MSTRRLSRGFSLIEIMVGLVIAMVGVVIMMEVLLSSEERSRTTGSANDALSTGAVTLHLLGRDLQQAGFAINATSLLNCSLALPSGATVTLAPITVNPDVSIVPAGDANTDRLIVIYGNPTSQPEGNTVSEVTGSDYRVQSPTSFNVGDWFITYPKSCAAALAMAKVTARTTSLITATAVNAAAVDGALYDMGKNPRVVAYRIKDAALQSCDFVANDCRNEGAHWTAMSGNIASLRAQYGHDTNVGSPDGIVDAWDQTSPTSACGWVKTTAVRVALVARSSQYESKIDSTGQRVCDAVTGAAGTGELSWAGDSGAPLDVSATAPTTWQCYRYRKFEKIIPTRNVAWMAAQSGC